MSEGTYPNAVATEQPLGPDIQNDPGGEERSAGGNLQR